MKNYLFVLFLVFSTANLFAEDVIYATSEDIKEFDALLTDETLDEQTEESLKKKLQKKEQKKFKNSLRENEKESVLKDHFLENQYLIRKRLQRRAP